METLPWWIWIVFAGMAFGLTMAIVTAVHENKRKLAKIQASTQGDASALLSREILTRLDAIDGRLGSVEKTLNDIPS